MPSRGERTAADLAILGARIRTLDPARPFASAVAVRDGEIVAVGDEAAVRDRCDARTELVDGRGIALVPGLSDAHLHPVWGAELAVGADLNGIVTLDGVRAALREEAARTPHGEWVRGWGLDYAVFDGIEIEGRLFEEAVGERPALLLLYDLHTAVATRAALAAAGIDGARTFDDASAVVVDGDGRPTGALNEPSAYRLALGALASATPDGQRAQVAGVLRRLNALGLTGGHAMDGTPETFALLRALEAAGELSMRLVAPLWQQPDATDEQIAAQLPLRDERGRRWRGGIAKLFIDGVIDSGTAWLYEPDDRGACTDPFWPDPARYREVVARFAQAGYQCVTHAVGDRAVGEVLDAYAAATAAGARTSNGAPHRVEHLETLTDADLRRVAADGVVASMQPLHMQWRAADGADEWTRRLGPERAARAYRVRDLLDAGAQVALGSDWPVASVDPRVGMAWARLRRTPGAPDAPVFEPEQVLTAEEALLGYTTWAAAAIGEQSSQGRIAEGFAADLTGFAQDPVETSADALVDLPVRLTMVDGEIVHRASS